MLRKIQFVYEVFYNIFFRACCVGHYKAMDTGLDFVFEIDFK